MRSNSKIVSLATLLALGLGPAAWAGSVDVELENLLDRNVTTPAQAPATVSVRQGPGGLEVSVVIEGTPGSVGPAVAAAGGRVRAVAGRFMTADLPLGAVRGIARRPDVRRVAAGSKLHPTNDLGNLPAGNGSRGAGQTVFGPTYVSSNAAAAAGQAGEGVIVAMVDSGLDLFHPDFRNPDGTTRVLYYWDHADYSRGGSVRRPTDLGFSYGREYTEADINNILAGRASIGSTARDTDGHGTHVMGTIAGNGRGVPGAPYAQYQFTGVAPKARIIAVKYDFDGSRNDSTYMVDAVRYCLARAGTTPCAVNMSLGMDFGPHDGTSLEEQMLDDVIGAAGAGKLVLVAAGNAGELGSQLSPTTHLPAADKIHGAMTIAAGETREISFRLQRNALGASTSEYVFFDIWYEGGTVCDVELVAPNGDRYTNAAWVTGGGGAGVGTPHGAVFVYNGGDQLDWGTDNGDHELYVEISDYQGNGPLQTYDLDASGVWKVRITATSGGSRFDGWHGLSTNLYGSAFAYDGARTDDRMTIGAPATANTVVAVGAYVTRQTWDTGRGSAGYNATSFPATVGDLAFFSSRGPSRDGRTLPHFATPGVGIISSLSADARAGFVAEGLTDFIIGPDVNTARYLVMQGTSMACPNATGVAALALVVNGGLTRASFLGYAQASARTDSFTGEDPVTRKPLNQNDWGAGKLDTPRLLASLPAPPPPPNNAPTADDGSAATQVDVPVQVTLQARDADNDPLTYLVATTSAQQGGVTVSGNVATYTPPAGFVGTDTFTFSVTDGRATSNLATITVTVSAAPPPSPAPTITSVSPNSGSQNQRLTVRVLGSNFTSGCTADFGADVAVQSVVVVSPGELSVQVKVGKRAAAGARDVRITNPDGQSATLAGGFRVN